MIHLYIYTSVFLIDWEMFVLGHMDTHAGLHVYARGSPRLKVHQNYSIAVLSGLL